LYLVGGTSLLLVAAKEVTLDVDVQFEIDPLHHAEWIRCIRQVRQQLAIPVEHAAPDHFIPLPAGYEGRHQYIGRYGRLEVFHFDFYSVALSKIHRGNEKDFTDLVAMVQQGLVGSEQLRRYFEEILPKLEVHDIAAMPDEFARKFDLFEERLRGATSATSSFPP
jgi:hypothetical protein